MCALCETAPREIMPHFIFIVDVIASYHGAPPKVCFDYYFLKKKKYF